MMPNRRHVGTVQKTTIIIDARLHEELGQIAYADVRSFNETCEWALREFVRKRKRQNHSQGRRITPPTRMQVRDRADDPTGEHARD